MIPDVVFEKYNIDKCARPYGNGHINDTYLTKDIVIQRINTDVFTDYKGLMKNVRIVTDYLGKVLKEIGRDPLRETLTIVKTVDGEDYLDVPEGVFRAYKYIPDTISYDETTKEMLYYSGVAFGDFQTLLNDFPADELIETIPDFHNTGKRLEAFKLALLKDVCKRAANCKKEIDYVLSCEPLVNVIIDKLKSGDLPLRTTHNDTKINNVLFDKNTGKPLCVIDFDTVMPGSFLFDFGDAVRSGSSSAAEDCDDYNNVYLDIEKYEYLVKGFLSSMGDVITEEELNLMSFSGFILTLECGMRFLGDYLSGDVYFKIHKEDHNLIRAKNQLKLAQSIYDNLSLMNKVVYDCYNNYKGGEK